MSTALTHVWILSEGELHEGAVVLGVYANEPAARVAFRLAMADLRARWKGWKCEATDDFATVGCDYLCVNKHEVLGKA